MNKQELKEKILEIIDKCYEESYGCDKEWNDTYSEHFRYGTCIEEIEKLFKEVE